MTSAERRIATRTWRTGAALAAAAAVLASLAAATQPWAAAPAPPPPVKCDKAAGPFHVSGTKVLEAHGKAFVPYGVTATGLAVRNYSVSVADQQIQGAALYWCVNTVRLQVAQGNLLPNGSTESAAFMAALKDAVRTAESYKLVVVISDQTEETGGDPHCCVHGRATFVRSPRFRRSACVTPTGYGPASTGRTSSRNSRLR